MRSLNIPYADFARLDIRVGRVVSAERIEGKSRILQGRVDVGDSVRNVIIGGAEFHDPDSMIDRRVIVLCNLEPKKVAGIESEAMLLAADVDGKPFWLDVDESVPVGSPVK